MSVTKASPSPQMVVAAAAAAAQEHMSSVESAVAHGSQADNLLLLLRNDYVPDKGNLYS